MSMLTMTCETPLAHERQRGDIRISKAEVRVNAAGFGPDSDGLINATFDFTNAMSKSPMMPITSYEEAALYLFQAATASGDMGVMSGLTSVMNRVAAPYEVYVTFEYEIYVGERTGFSRFFRGRENWVHGGSISNDRVYGPSGGYFFDRHSANQAGIQRLSEHWNEGANNIYARLRRWKGE